MIEGVGLLPYSERLQILQLTTLAERRSRGDLIEVYKASQGSQSIPLRSRFPNPRSSPLNISLSELLSLTRLIPVPILYQDYYS
ncbi:hypothetical protein ACHWQZ_G016298 [Mnemiopsis leidyi]